MSPFTELTFATMRTDKCVGYEMMPLFESGIRPAGNPQSSQVSDIPECRVISVARLCACDQTDGSTPASLKTDTVRFTVEDWERLWAGIVCGKLRPARIRRTTAAFFMNPLLAGMRKSAASGGVPQGLTGNVRLKRR